MSSPHDIAKRFVVATRDAEHGLLFWSTDDGFVGLDQASVFSRTETTDLALPVTADPPRWLALPSLCDDPPPEIINPKIPGRVRFEFLDRIHDLMSQYLLDECPDGEKWEDFDPEIDGLRWDISDLRDREAGYLANFSGRPLRFVIEVEFLSKRERFATETYEVEALDSTAAKRIALGLSDDSPYDNQRIPGLERRAIDRTDRDRLAPD